MQLTPTAKILSVKITLDYEFSTELGMQAPRAVQMCLSTEINMQIMSCNIAHPQTFSGVRVTSPM